MLEKSSSEILPEHQELHDASVGTMLIYKEIKNKKRQFVQYQNLFMIDRKNPKRDGKEKLNFNERQVDYRQQVAVMNSKYATVWNQLFG